MSTSTLIRYSGLVAVLGGVLLAIGAIGDPESESAHFGSLTLSAHVLILIATMGLYARQHREARWTGQAGLVMAIIGNMLVTAVVAFSAYLQPDLEVLLDELEELVEEGPWGVFAPIGESLFVLGYILLGIDTIIARLLPAWGAVSMIVGVAILHVGFSTDVSFIGVAGAVVFGAALAWLGYAVWSEKEEAAANG